MTLGPVGVTLPGRFYGGSTVIDKRFYELITHLWRGGKFSYYWGPNIDGQKLTYWVTLDGREPPEVPKMFWDTDAYFAVNPTIIRRSEHERAQVKHGDIAVINCLYFEIDCDTPEEQIAALKRIDALPWKAAAVVFSGGGYHVYILLRQPYLLDTPDKQAHAFALQYAMVEFAGGDDGAKDLARVLRIPGTFNHKPEFATPPEVQFERFDLSLQYDLADFEPHLQPLVEARAAKAHSHHSNGNGTGPSAAVGLDDQTLLDVLFRSKNGDMYRRLWDGDYSMCVGQGGRPDHSKGDQTLCNGLAWVTGRDIRRMDDMFRRSGMMRDKWRDRDDYREDTLGKAADSAQTVYDPTINGQDPAAAAFAASAVGLGGVGAPPPTNGTGGNSGGSSGSSSSGGNSSQQGRKKRGRPRNKQASYPAIGREYMQINQHTIYARSHWYRYEGGMWATLHDLSFESEVWDLLEQHDPFPTDNGVKNVIKFVRSKRVKKDDELDCDDGLINLQNGTYSLELQALLAHQPGHYLTTQLPFAYDLLSPCPNWRRYLETTFIDRAGQVDADLIAFVQEAVGYSLTTDIHHHVSFWCYGEGANGKGVLFYVLERLAGNSAIPFNVDLLKREQYQLADLAGKRIALCPEADSSGVVEDAVIKALVGGDSLQVRQIRREPFTLHPVAKLWWSMNKLPTITDSSTGMWRRIKLIPFLADFQGRDKHKRIENLRELLQDELPGIFNWAMEGLARLTANGEFTTVKQIEEWTAMYRRDSNAVLTFVDETCDTDRGYNVGSNVIYTRYKDWCADNGYKPYNVRNFKTEMERIGFFWRRTSTHRLFDGLRLKGQGNTIP